MKESGYYPAGAEFDPDAPYNERERQPIPVDVCVSYSLSKNFTIDVDDYRDIPNYEEGGNVKTTTPDFQDTNFEAAFLDNSNEVMGIPALLTQLVSMASEKRDKLKKRMDYKSKEECKRLSAIIDSAKGWITDDYCVSPNY